MPGFRIKITSRAQRERLGLDLLRMKEAIANLADGPSSKAPKHVRTQHALVLKSARANARELQAQIKDWDCANPAPKVRRSRSLDMARRRPARDRVAPQGKGRASAAARADKSTGSGGDVPAAD